MKIKYILIPMVIFAFIVSIIFLMPNINSVSAYNLSVSSSAKGMCVLEKESKRVIASKNENMCLPMASTTKVVTAITVIQNCKDLDEYVQVDDSAIGVEGTSIYLKHGELIKVRDLLYGLMLRSGNDSAVALACHI